MKFGCSIWNVSKCSTTAERLDALKPSLLKRVLQLPQSTPSSGIQYDFGINDLGLEILMEKVIRAVTALQHSENRIVTQILKAMLAAHVPGFCTEVIDACRMLGTSLEELMAVKDVRKFLTDKQYQTSYSH